MSVPIIPVSVGMCAACRVTRPLAGLLAFWPIGEPAAVRYICRPGEPLVSPISCFRRLTRSASVEVIAPAAEHVHVTRTAT